MQKFKIMAFLLIAFMAAGVRVEAKKPAKKPVYQWKVRFWNMEVDAKQAAEAVQLAMRYRWEILPLAQETRLWVYYSSKADYLPDITPQGVMVYVDASKELGRKPFSAEYDLVKFRVMRIAKCGNKVLNGEGWFKRPRKNPPPPKLPPPPRQPLAPPVFFGMPAPHQEQRQKMKQEQRQEQTVIVNNYSVGAAVPTYQVGTAMSSGGVYGSVGVGVFSPGQPGLIPAKGPNPYQPPVSPGGPAGPGTIPNAGNSPASPIGSPGGMFGSQPAPLPVGSVPIQTGP